ncbi:hypothetical protein BOX15_Mlig028733g1, partial [Macrostomum lignano]
VTTLSGEGAVAQVDASPDMTVSELLAVCRAELRMPAGNNIVLLHNGQPLNSPQAKLSQAGVTDGDMIIAQPMPNQQQMQQQQQRQRQQPARGGGGGGAAGGMPLIDFSGVRLGSGGSGGRQAQPQRRFETDEEASAAVASNPEILRQALLSMPEQLAALRQQNPQLADAVSDPDRFAQLVRTAQSERSRAAQERARLMAANPYDPRVQQEIQSLIQQQNIDSSMETALEHMPEAFAPVNMLYIDVKVNGHPVKAFVDSGAQMTIMSLPCAQRCNVERLIDKRWAGIARGVGTQTIVGRIHLGQLQIGGDYLACNFSVLRDQSMDLLLGLDMLKRHQCLLDLKSNKLVIGTTGTVAPFLSEADLPEDARASGGGSGGEGGKPITQESIDAVVAGGPDGTTADDAREALMHALGEVDAAIAFLVAKQSERSGQ